MTAEPFLPLAFTIEHFSFIIGAKNKLGNEKESWGEPAEKEVYGWGPPESKTQFTQADSVIEGDQRYIVDLQLLVPPGWTSKHRDRFRLEPGGEIYRQVGPTQMFDHNPFGWNPGGVVLLVAVSGATFG